MRWILLVLVAANVAFLAWRLSARESPGADEPRVVASAAQVNRLLMLSEIDAGELRRRAPAEMPAADRAAAERPSDTAPGGACFSIGPMEGREQIERMGSWLVERGARTRLRPDERREITLYWIYLPPFPTREGAEERVAEMRAKGIDDIFIINRGDMARAVSLGVYSRKTSLERRVGSLEEKGYRPEVAVRYRQKKAAWYDARFDAGYEFPVEVFTLAFPGAQARETPCSPAAAAKLKPSGLPKLPGSEPEERPAGDAAAG